MIKISKHQLNCWINWSKQKS